MENILTQKELDEALGNIDSNITKQQKEETDQRFKSKMLHHYQGRAFFKNQFSYPELCIVEQVLLQAKESLREDYEAEKLRREKREEVRNEIEKELKAKGYSLRELFTYSDLDPNPPKIRKKSATYGQSPILYHCHIFEKDYYWTGKGLTPEPFRCAYLNESKVKKDFLLESPLPPQKSNFKIPDKYREDADALLEKWKGRAGLRAS